MGGVSSVDVTLILGTTITLCVLCHFSIVQQCIVLVLVSPCPWQASVHFSQSSPVVLASSCPPSITDFLIFGPGSILRTLDVFVCFDYADILVKCHFTFQTWLILQKKATDSKAVLALGVWGGDEETLQQLLLLSLVMSLHKYRCLCLLKSFKIFLAMFYIFHYICFVQLMLCLLNF